MLYVHLYERSILNAQTDWMYITYKFFFQNQYSCACIAWKSGVKIRFFFFLKDMVTVTFKTLGLLLYFAP